MFRKFLSFFILFFLFNINGKSVDLVAFSYDRPLQLYSFLESVKKYISGLSKIFVIYRVSDTDFDKAYEIVKKDFPYVNFYKQNNLIAENEFKDILIKFSFEDMTSDYIIFGVDDIIVKDFVNMNECVNALEKSDCYAFYLRLGKNITQCYMHNDEHTPVPNCNEILPNIFEWKFNNGVGDWKYPNNVDMTLYKKSVIQAILYSIDFKNPSDLESKWAAKSDYNLKGMFFTQSKIVNIPLNIVHNELLNINNRSAYIFSKFDLLKIFNCGLKIDINSFYRVENIAPHAAIEPKFVKR